MLAPGRAGHEKELVSPFFETGASGDKVCPNLSSLKLNMRVASTLRHNGSPGRKCDIDCPSLMLPSGISQVGAITQKFFLILNAPVYSGLFLYSEPLDFVIKQNRSESDLFWLGLMLVQGFANQADLMHSSGRTKVLPHISSTVADTATMNPYCFQDNLT
ncbi:unnamed protein product [Protopolystoma xenopodis]|uniref:Uncharacterized protein n=1 Tax=Protopolystoma xenopodis TaxID=117903 RepID=A0A3S5CID7_9PLAT|nr:unnamed protein product [Protopolystoma xenopodis]